MVAADRQIAAQQHTGILVFPTDWPALGAPASSNLEACPALEVPVLLLLAVKMAGHATPRIVGSTAGTCAARDRQVLQHFEACVAAGLSDPGGYWQISQQLP